ncbi:hypothetical protein [Arthrobacter woluwensis]|uniref:hypothetical protein n=1 Tax=Arthrobacter woluwensis TaxID=156980 RepID=UPI00119FD6E2|nr:hypothetical protein [Arthrobacter woluwensis]
MSLPRRDRLYPKPRQTRHAWLLEGDPPEAQMRQVLIVEWRRHSYKWRARVVYVIESVSGSEEPAVVDRWVPAEVLRPVKSNPNTLFGVR